VARRNQAQNRTLSDAALSMQLSRLQYHLKSHTHMDETESETVQLWRRTSVSAMSDIIARYGAIGEWDTSQVKDMSELLVKATTTA
jgi:hypothetical protein